MRKPNGEWNWKQSTNRSFFPLQKQNVGWFVHGTSINWNNRFHFIDNELFPALKLINLALAFSIMFHVRPFRLREISPHSTPLLANKIFIRYKIRAFDGILICHFHFIDVHYYQMVHWSHVSILVHKLIYDISVIKARCCYCWCCCCCC